MIDLYCCVSLTGDIIKEYYLPFLVPVGVVGNSLSFLVRIRKILTN